MRRGTRGKRRGGTINEREERTHESTENSLLKVSGGYNQAPWAMPRPIPGHVVVIGTDAEPYCPAINLRARTSGAGRSESRWGNMVVKSILARESPCDVDGGIRNGT